MNFQKNNLIEKDLILVGGGHSNVKLLMDFVKKPISNIRVTLITSVIDTPYSGMLPGYIQGLYSWRNSNIDLYKLSIVGKIRFILGKVKNINGLKKEIYFKDRCPIQFDYLSINIGIESDFSRIPGAKKYTIPLKPIAELNKNLQYKEFFGESLGIIGAGAAGVEVSFALKERLKNAKISLFSGKNGILPQYNNSTKKNVRKCLNYSKINLIENDPVLKIKKNLIITANNLKFKFDKIILATNGLAPKWLKNTDLEICKSGFIQTNNKFQTNFNYIFASGDVINFDNKNIPKAGVYAVKSGKILSQNIRNFILDKKLKIYTPQKYYLSLIGLGSGNVLAHKYKISFSSKINFWIKKIIDQNFVNKYTINNLDDFPMKSQKKQDNIEMVCKGCAAKISIDVLKKSIPKEISYLSNDSSIIPSTKNFYHTVDMINSIISDPFYLGMIAANHSLSDIYASGANPVSGQMILQLPIANSEIHIRDIKQIFSGANEIFKKNGCEISGGHTMIGEDDLPVIGFSIIGKGNNLKKNNKIKNGDLLFLTGSLGTGLIFSGINNLKIDSFYQLPVLRQMLEGNRSIGNLFKLINPISATDITGYGLANHLINLIQRSNNLRGLTLNLENLPIFDGVELCLNQNVKSSFYDQNYNFAKDKIFFEEVKSKKQQVLFDPQTVGGIAFIAPKTHKIKITKILNKNNVSFKIIGRVDNSHKFLKIIN